MLEERARGHWEVYVFLLVEDKFGLKRVDKLIENPVVVPEQGKLNGEAAARQLSRPYSPVSVKKLEEHEKLRLFLLNCD